MEFRHHARTRPRVIDRIIGHTTKSIEVYGGRANRGGQESGSSEERLRPSAHESLFFRYPIVATW
jgi:hypothetical protein